MDDKPLPFGELSAKMYVAGHFAELSQLMEPRVRKEDMLNVVDFFFQRGRVKYLANLIENNFSKSEEQRKEEIIGRLVNESILVVMMGARRYGKTATSFDLAQIIHDMDTGKEICWFGYSDAVKKYYPWMRQVTNLRKLENVFLLFDEAAIFLDARDSMTTERKKIIRQIPIQGHKDITTIYMTQVEGVDPRIRQFSDWIWFKPYPDLDFTDTSNAWLSIHRFMIPNQKNQNYIYDRQNGDAWFFSNDTPKVWNDELSKPYSLIKKKEDAISYYTELKEAGLSLKEAETMIELRGWSYEELVSDEVWMPKAPQRPKTVQKQRFPGPQDILTADIGKPENSAIDGIMALRCARCGSFDRQRYGSVIVGGVKKQKWRCTSCGAITRD